MRKAFVVAVVVIAAACMGPGMGGGMGGMGRGRFPGGGGGGRGQGRGPNDGQLQAPSFPAASDLQKYNPAQLLIDHKEDIVLADSQVAKLGAVRQKISDRNAPLLARYDTLQRAYRPPQGGYGRNRGGGQQQADSSIRATFAQAQALRAAADTVLSRRLVDVSDAMAVMVSDLQKSRAANELAAQDRDLRAKLQPAPGGMGRGRRGGDQR